MYQKPHSLKKNQKENCHLALLTLLFVSCAWCISRHTVQLWETWMLLWFLWCVEYTRTYLSSGYRVCLCGETALIYVYVGRWDPPHVIFFNHHGKKFIEQNSSPLKKNPLWIILLSLSVRRIEGKERGRYAITSKEIQLDCSLMRPPFLFPNTEGFINAQ